MTWVGCGRWSLKLTLWGIFSVCVINVCAQDAIKTERSTTGNGALDQTPQRSLDDNIVFECEVDDTGCVKDKEGYDAISSLHHLLDDDQNGNVDQSESDEFLRDELQYTDGFERQKTFHGNDKLISIKDLWLAWKGSTVYNWTIDEVLEWLECHVELPQYIEVFHTKSVDGKALPRLAYSNSNFFATILGIKNAVHKQKISVKAMDAVLFGPPKKAHSYIKDIALVTSLIIAFGGCYFAYVHHHYSQGHVKKMMRDLESLQKAEDALHELQEKLVMAEEKQNSVSIEKQNLEAKYKDEIDAAKKEAERLKVARQGNNMEESLRLAEEELAQVRAALRRSEKELELHEHWSVPSELQAWLQLTHELEQVHYLAKRSAAEKQLFAAKESCDKIRKRNKAFLGSLRMAHGNSLDDIDQRILIARNAFEEVKQDLQERLHRWHTIESLCGFPVMSNPGLPTLKQILQKDASQSSRMGSGLIGPVGVEDADEDLPPSYPSVMHSTVVNGSIRPRALSGYQSSTQGKGTLPRLRTGTSGSTGSLSRVGVTNGTSRDSPSLSDHGSTGQVSFHLGDKSPHHMHHLVGAHHHHGTMNGPLLTSSPISESPSTDELDSPNTQFNCGEDPNHMSNIPLSKSFCITPSQSQSSLTTIPQSLSTSALKRMAVNGHEATNGEQLLNGEEERKKKKMPSLFKMLRKSGNKTKAS